MPGPHGGTLRLMGLCAYCEAPTESSCRLCGTSACAEHLDGGVCLGCETTRVDD